MATNVHAGVPLEEMEAEGYGAYVKLFDADAKGAKA